MTINHPNIWVSGNRKEGYTVVSEGTEEPLHKTVKQKEAITFGRELAKIRRCELIIQNQNGKIRSKDSYGNESKAKDTEN